MSAICITRDDQGKLVGLGEKDNKAWTKLVRRMRELEAGELLQFDVWFPRNSKLHKLHFVMLSAFFDAQEQFPDLEQFRMWAAVGAGHCEFVPGPKGKMVALPKSISFRALDDAEFSAHHEAVKEFFRTTYASRFLWPHLSDTQQAEMVDSILVQFEQPA